MSGTHFPSDGNQRLEQLLENTHLSDASRSGTLLNNGFQDQHPHVSSPNSGLPGHNHHPDLSEVIEEHSSFLIVHRVTCDRGRVDGEDHQDHPKRADFLDAPRLYAGDTRASVLRGQESFYYSDEIAPGIYMIVIRTYNCANHHKETKDSFEFDAPKVHAQVLNKMRPYFFTLRHVSPPARSTSESVTFTSETLSHAMSIVTNSQDFALTNWNADNRLRAPYNYFYYFRYSLRKKSVTKLIGEEQAELNGLLDYID